MQRCTRGPILVLLGALASGCSDGPGEGTLVLHLADAPYPFDLVRSTEVLIDSVSVRVGGGAVEDDSGFLTVDRTPYTVDLLELRSGVTASLGSSTIPAGDVDQIRVYVGEATIVLTDDRSFPLTFPSGSSSGVKVFPSPPIHVGDGEVVDVLLDFDLSQSFSASPASPTRAEDIVSFSFHPVLHAANLTDVGAVSGMVASDAGTPADPADDVPLPGAAVVATRGATEITSTASDANGRYVLMGLPPGETVLTASVSDGIGPAAVTVSVAAAEETSGVNLLLSPTASP